MGNVQMSLSVDYVTRTQLQEWGIALSEQRIERLTDCSLCMPLMIKATGLTP
ncbi:MAG: hypothetical protein HC934_08830 [Acaryochloridaceae cyanobacterium SU_2_1]|nr:hypothetical protein [Acaryochloridaceae cyanobacterium SU_2_1]NJM95220.1 hypothetical protein [Acaryochloridaceae cyanobacterium CSU_5_19]